MGLKGDVCELHREQLKMFCKEDGLIMCEACSQSPEHEAHSVLPMEDVTWEYKWELHEALEHLRKEQDEAWKLEVECGVEVREPGLLQPAFSSKYRWKPESRVSCGSLRNTGDY